MTATRVTDSALKTQHDQARSPSHPFRWFPEFLELGQRRFRAQGHLLGAAMLVGIVAGIGAVLFASACHLVAHYALGEVVGYQPPGPNGESRLPWLKETARTFHPWLLLIVPALGGLVSGWIVFRFAPEAEGHGTDAAVAAYHYRDGQMRARVPLVKILASAITLGTGGSGGREGPIAQIGAGCGSVLGNLFHFTPAHRRVLLAAGIGAGVAAIFRAPLAGALFAAEILYRSPEFESEVILPAGLASVVSYCTFGLFFGWAPLFQTPLLSFSNPWMLGPYTLLAIFMAFMAMLYTRTFYGITHLFRRWNISNYAKPVIGAFATGLLALGLYYLCNEDQVVLAVLSAGYGILQQGFLQPTTLTFAVLLAVSVGKILTTSLTIGSGGSGGVFGPAMVIGGCAGGALGLLLHEVWRDLVPNPASFMLLGMAGFFAAAAKTPFSTLVIVSEMTGDYRMILPSLWVCVLAYLLSDEQSIYSSQVASRSRSPAHQGSYVREILADFQVAQFLQPLTEVPVLKLNDSLDRVLDQLAHTTFLVLPVVDGEQRLVGVVNLEEVHLAANSPHMRSWILVEDLMRTKVVPLRPEYRLDQAIELFAENDLPALPVVEDRRPIGMVRRSDIARHYLLHVHGRKRTDGEVTA